MEWNRESRNESTFTWSIAAAAAAKLLQSCPTLCDPIDGSPPGSHIPGILQAKTLEWVAISFSNAWKWKVKVRSFSHVGLFATPWTAAHQAPPSTGFSRQEYWSGLPFSSPSYFLEDPNDSLMYSLLIIPVFYCDPQFTLIQSVALEKLRLPSRMGLIARRMLIFHFQIG